MENEGFASFCTAAPPPIPLLGLLMRIGEVREGGWETWSSPLENGGGGGLEKVVAVMMVEFRSASVEGGKLRVVGEVNVFGWLV